jgi:transcriptional regulator with XRE-family HTH domain
MTASELAERAGTSVATVGRIERGDPTVAVGTVVEAARVAGVRFFDADRGDLPALVERASDRLAVLPARVREPAGEVDDDF